MLLKLIRLVRVKRIFNLLDPNRINKLVDTLFSGQTRSKKVVFQLIVKNVNRVFRLILQTVLMTYFTGAIFYFFSVLFEPEEQRNVYTCSEDTDSIMWLTEDKKQPPGFVNNFRVRFDLQCKDGLY